MVCGPKGRPNGSLAGIARQDWGSKIVGRRNRPSQRSPDGGFYATSVRGLATGFMLDTDPAKPRLYFRLPHLGAASWAALAERGFNPFTATKDFRS